MKTSKMCAIFSNQHEYSQLKPLTDERALSTLYFAGKYRLMDFALSSIVNAGINHVYTLISQEKVRSYLDHLGGGKEWGLDTIGAYEYLDFYQNLMQRRARGEEYFNDLILFLKTCKMPYTVFIGNKMAANFD
ncbi:sugar phosphate nucleotidyltransferase, partial [Lactobacillus sp.]